MKDFLLSSVDVLLHDPLHFPQRAIRFWGAFILDLISKHMQYLENGYHYLDNGYHYLDIKSDVTAPLLEWRVNFK